MPVALTEAGSPIYFVGVALMMGFFYVRWWRKEGWNKEFGFWLLAAVCVLLLMWWSAYVREDDRDSDSPPITITVPTFVLVPTTEPPLR